MHEGTGSASALFGKVVKNALDYLDRSIDEVESHPKYSVVNFVSGVELVLKARLLMEHWSLIATRPGEVSLADLENGNFKSVTMVDALNRLEKVAGLKFSEKERSAYQVVRDHRNSLIHFFDSAYAETLDRAAATSLQEKQFRAWYFLQRRVREWGAAFDPFTPEIRRIDSSLRLNWGFLKIKFEHVKGDVEKLEGSGTPVISCPACSFRAAVLDSLDAPLDEFRCLVCETDHELLQIVCPSCGEKLEVYEGGSGECSCGDFSASLDWVIEYLDRRMPPRKESLESIYCWECQDPKGTVIKRNDGLVCAGCFAIHETIAECEYCGSMNAGGNVDASYFTGCAICDGRGDRD